MGKNGKKEGGFSNPPTKSGGQECPPSFESFGEDCFVNPYAPIDRHEHHLPHWQQGAVFYFVTWRLADSLSSTKLKAWKYERELWLRLHPEPWDEKSEEEYHERFSRKIDEWLDQGQGSCLLRDVSYSALVAKAMLHFDGERYVVASFVVMPNHVHVLFRVMAPYRLEQIVKSWKGFSAREINRRTGKVGSLWQEDYWDRLIRNSRHFYKCLQYIRENPVKACLQEKSFVLYESKEGGFSNPPAKSGGQECPPPV
jgi:REP element-mobilizing transposase RayT